MCDGRKGTLAARTTAYDVDLIGGNEAGGCFGQGGLGAGGAGVGFFLIAEVFGAEAGFFLEIEVMSSVYLEETCSNDDERCIPVCELLLAWEARRLRPARRSALRAAAGLRGAPSSLDRVPKSLVSVVDAGIESYFALLSVTNRLNVVRFAWEDGVSLKSSRGS